MEPAEKQSLSGAQQRIDKWLFFARIMKSRSLAQALVAGGGVTVNGKSVLHSSSTVRPGDTLEVLLEHRDMRLVVRDCGTRRGPFEEARQLYQELSEEAEPRRLTPFEKAQRRLRPRSGSGGS